MRKRIRSDMIFFICFIALVSFTARSSLSGEYRSMRPDLGGKVISAFIKFSDNKTFYAGTPSGMLKSCAAVINLSPKHNGLTNAGILALVIDPVNTNVLYCGSRGGAFRSTDGGLNWISAGTGLKNTEVLTLAVDPVKTRTLYAGTRRGVYKSSDGGDNWILMENFLSEVAILSIAIDPNNTGTIYAIARDAAWVMAVYMNAKNESKLKSNLRDCAFKSENGGEKWSSIDVGFQEINLKLESLAIDPSNPSTLYAGTRRGVFKSVDFGATWPTKKCKLKELNIKSIAFDAHNGNIIYAGTMVGVFKSTDGGNNWTYISNGLQIC